MEHIIRKVEYVTGNTRSIFVGNIETDNIESTRKELHGLVKCDRILLVYESVSKSDKLKQEQQSAKSMSERHGKSTPYIVLFSR